MGVTVAGIAVVTIVLGMDAQARSITDMNRQQQELRDERAELRARLAEAQAEQQITRAEMYMLEIDLFEAEHEYLAALENLEHFENLLAQTEQELAEAEAAKEERLEVLRNHIRFMHENNRMSYVELLLASENLSEFVNNRGHFRRILEHDQYIIDTLAALEAEIAEARDDIDRQRNAIELHTMDLAMALVELEAVIAQREARMMELMADEAHYAALGSDMDDAIASVVRDIASAQAAENRRVAEQRTAAMNATVRTNNENSVFHWPLRLAPHINSAYGWRDSPTRRGTREFHTGVDMRAPFNTAILSADYGVVTHAGWRNGYGNTIIIAHAGGLSTLYAHIANGRILVNVGDWVERGQHIAGVGSTGQSTGNHLHFEVLRNGNHVDPVPFLQ